MNTNPPTQGGKDPRLAWLTGSWLYNEIMSQIEPDLTEDKIALLDKKYAEETEEQYRVRMDWYAEAFAIFDAALTMMTDSVVSEAATWKKKMRTEAEKREQQVEAEQIAALEEQMDIADTDA